MPSVSRVRCEARHPPQKGRNMPSREHVESFVKVVEAGDFVEAMEAYYADDATMQ